MALTLYEAAKLSRNPLAAGIFKAIVTQDELFSLLPFVGKAGDSFSYNREKALPSAEWVSPTHTSLAESSATFDQVTVPKREIASNMDLYNFALANQDGAAQLAAQVSRKARAVGRELSRAFIQGGYADTVTYNAAIAEITASVAGPFLDSNRWGLGVIEFDTTNGWRFQAPGDRDFGPYVAPPGAATVTLVSDNPNKYLTITASGNPVANASSSVAFTSTTEEPDGLELMTSVIRPPDGANGDAYDLGILDELIDECTVGGQLVFSMNSALIRKHYETMRGLGGTTPETVSLPTYMADGMAGTRTVLAYRGIPIVKNDNILQNVTVGGTNDTGSIYLMSLEDEVGVYAGAFGGSSMNIDLDPFDALVMGFQMIDVGQLEEKNARRWRAAWYGGFALGSSLACVRASGISPSL